MWLITKHTNSDTAVFHKIVVSGTRHSINNLDETLVTHYFCIYYIYYFSSIYK